MAHHHIEFKKQSKLAPGKRMTPDECAARAELCTAHALLELTASPEYADWVAAKQQQQLQQKQAKKYKLLLVACLLLLLLMLGGWLAGGDNSSGVYGTRSFMSQQVMCPSVVLPWPRSRQGSVVVLVSVWTSLAASCRKSRLNASIKSIRPR